MSWMFTKKKRGKKRRHSYSEEPELLNEINLFEPGAVIVFNTAEENVDCSGGVRDVLNQPEELPLDAVAEAEGISENDQILMDSDMKVDLPDDGEEEEEEEDEEGLLGLDDDSDTIIIKCDGSEQEVPSESRRLIGLLDAAMTGDDSTTELDCTNKVSPMALEIIKEYVTHRLDNEAFPFTHKVPKLPCQSLRISDRFDLEMLNSLSLELIFELALSCDYLQVDSLLDGIYKHIIIKLSDCSQPQIVAFLENAQWPKENGCTEISKDDVEEDLVDWGTEQPKKETDHDIEIANLDEKDKIEIIPNDDIGSKDIDLDAVLLREGPISGAISLLRDDAISAHPSILKMPIMFWGRIADHSSARKKLLVSRKQAALSPILLEAISEQEDSTDAMVYHAKNCCRKYLALAVDWLHHHNGREPAEIARPIRSVDMSKIVEDQYDADFVDNMDKKTLFNVVLTAKNMEITGLLQLCCAKMASLIKGKSIDEMRRILGDEDMEE